MADSPRADALQQALWRPVGRSDGAVRCVSLTVQSVLDAGGQVIESRSIAADVTDRRQSAEIQRRLARAERARGRGGRTGGIAHAINNPMAALQINLDLIRAAAVEIHDGPERAARAASRARSRSSPGMARRRSRRSPGA